MSSYHQSRLDALNQIGETRSNFEGATTGVETACGDFIKRVQNNIEDRGLVATGNMGDLKLEIVDSTHINILGYEYILFMDAGVSGTVNKYNTPYSYTNKMPPPSVFVEWIKTKNIKIRNANGKDSFVDENSVDSAAYAMALNKKRQGQEPTHILSDEMEQLANDAAEGAANTVITTFLNL